MRNCGWITLSVTFYKIIIVLLIVMIVVKIIS